MYRHASFVEFVHGETELDSPLLANELLPLLTVCLVACCCHVPSFTHFTASVNTLEMGKHDKTHRNCTRETSCWFDQQKFRIIPAQHYRIVDLVEDGKPVVFVFGSRTEPI